MSKQLYFFILLSILLSGCAASIMDRTNISYIKEGFKNEDVKLNGLAFLPVVAGQGVEGYRRPFGEAINESMSKNKTKEMNFLKWQETLSCLNDSNLATNYNNAIVTYNETAIIDKNLLNNMGVATKTKYFLFVQLGDFENSSELKYSFLTRNTYNQKTVGLKAFAQIWDASNGDVVWEGIADVSAQSSEFSHVKDSDPQTYSKIAAESLVKKILNIRSK